MSHQSFRQATPSRAAAVGLHVFVRVRTTDDAVTGRGLFVSIASARDALACHDDEYVTSRESHAIGVPKALRPDQCRGCGTKPREAGRDRCTACEAERHRAERARQRNGGPARGRA